MGTLYTFISKLTVMCFSDPGESIHLDVIGYLSHIGYKQTLEHDKIKASFNDDV